MMFLFCCDIISIATAYTGTCILDAPHKSLLHMVNLSVRKGLFNIYADTGEVPFGFLTQESLREGR